MRKVRCHECGKSYDYDVNDFCPRCGAFTAPAKSVTVSAEGKVVRVDGLNEVNHQESFVHEELHKENRSRRRSGLDQNGGSAAKNLAKQTQTVRREYAGAASDGGKAGKRNNIPLMVTIASIIFFIFVINLVNALIELFL